MMTMIITVWGIAAILAAAAAYVLARRKARNPDAWTFAAFLLPPLVIVLALLGPARTPYRRPPRSLVDDN